MKVFISYSSRDRDIRQYIERELAVHLNALAPNTYTLWSDAGIDIGANWREVIETQMAESDAALLLVSPGFMASEFINNVELTEFFRRKQEAGYILIPVEIRHTPNWGELAQLNFFKTYRTDYGFTRPADRTERLAFEQLYDNDRTTDAQLNTYFTKLAECVHGAFLGRMKKDSSTPL
ncbi:MAG: toll/interleukin-1 receptor domain-containing protein, partial [Bernardetiaceae bacterium]